MNIKAIVTGATGMVGEGVLLECLANPNVTEVLVITRKPTGRTHPKLKEIIHADFFNIEPIAAQLQGCNACYFCLGISSVGVSKEDYRHITYDLTLHVGQVLAKLNPDMTFCYVTGAGTDSTEQGKVNWARVKGATENQLLKLFKNGYMFRPGFMKPTPGQRNILPMYKYIAWMYPIGRKIYPAGFCTLEEVGKAMVNITIRGYEEKIITVKDIVAIAAQ
jgi:uncharacterized protein YbjT (DUF2867 family)